MIPKNWINIKDAGSFEKLPVGWYVCRIVAVEDKPSREYLSVVWDVSRGENAGHYAKDEEWSHRTCWSYCDKAEGIFKSHLTALEESNARFSVSEWQVASDEKKLIGLEFGAAIQERYYTNDKGEDKTAIEIARVVSVDKALANAAEGKELPKPRDNRTKVEDAVAYNTDTFTNMYGEDVPF